MNLVTKLLCLLLFFSACSLAVDQSHHNAAHELMRLLQQKSGTLFIDTVVHTITRSDSALKKHELDIYTLIQTYLNSPEYKETRINAIMYYFSEPEIRAIVKVVKNPSFTNHSPEQVALFKKYERVFNRLEKEFIEYMKERLKIKYRRESGLH